MADEHNSMNDKVLFFIELWVWDVKKKINLINMIACVVYGYG